jgi:hypothetical protein
MDPTLPAITPEMRNALKASGGSPIQLQDLLTKKVYWMAKQPTHPSLDEEFIRAGLQIALDQYARGEFDDWNNDRVIAEAERLYAEQQHG